jgi:protein ImuB
MARRERAAAGARAFRGLERAVRAAQVVPVGSPSAQGELALPVPAPAGGAAQTATVAAEVWAALWLPALMLEAPRWRGSVAPSDRAAPRVVLQPDAAMPRVLAANAAARERGVAPGFTLSAALALEPVLEALPRDLRREQRLLRRLGEIALDFTPRVSLEPPDALLLELRGSFALFGGPQALAQQLLARCVGLGVAPRLALAPTPLAAVALVRAAGARAGQPVPFIGVDRLAGTLAPLPLAVLRWPPDLVERLEAVGAATLGEVLRLPRAGFARRFGATALDALDRLVGRRPDPRHGFRRRERFEARCEPSFELSAHDAILRQVDPLLAGLERFLRRRQSAVTALELRLQHRANGPSPACTRVVLRLAAPEFAAARFAPLLAERLARIVLPAPVVRCVLRGGELQPWLARSEPAWQPGEHGGGAPAAAPAFVERLRARLGIDAVYGLRDVAEHRPERAWRVADPVLSDAAAAGAGGPAPHLAARPLWLLPEPRRLPQGPQGLSLVAGPERIESGWWDDGDVERDYYVALDHEGARLWVFRERRAPHGWYLHGVFG